MAEEKNPTDAPEPLPTFGPAAPAPKAPPIPKPAPAPKAAVPLPAADAEQAANPADEEEEEALAPAGGGALHASWMLSAAFHTVLLITLSLMAGAMVRNALLPGDEPGMSLVSEPAQPTQTADSTPAQAAAQPITEQKLEELLKGNDKPPTEAPPALDLRASDRSVPNVQRILDTVAPRLSPNPPQPSSPPVSPGDLEPSEAIAKLLEESGADEPSPGSVRVAPAAPAVSSKGIQGTVAVANTKDDEEASRLGQQLRDNGHRHQYQTIQELLDKGTPKSIEEVVYSLRAMARCPRHQATRELEQITGQSFGLDVDAWEKWWNENKGTFNPDTILQQRLAAQAKQLRSNDLKTITAALANLARINSPLAMGVIIQALPDLLNARTPLAIKNAYETLDDMLAKYRAGTKVSPEPAAWQRWWDQNKDALLKGK